MNKSLKNKIGAVAPLHRSIARLAYALMLISAFASSAGVNPVKLTPIPDSAELIFSKPVPGLRTSNGFVSNELHVADSNGEGITRITHSGRLYNHFAVSPNRKMIAAIRFAGDTNKNGKIEERDWKTLWVLDLDNGKEWPLLSKYNAGWGGVDWSPDGRYIYLSVMIDGQTDVYRLRPDGSDVKNITKNLNRLLGVRAPGKWVSDVSVSNDGELIAFLYTVSKKDPNRIAVSRVDGSQAWLVTDGGGKDSKHAGGVWGPGDYDPEFSPDGRYLTFQRATDALLLPGNVSSHDAMRIKSDGTELRRLSPPGNKAIHAIPDWSDDDRIVFTEWSSIDRYIGPVIVHADGSNYHRVTSLEGGTWVRWIRSTRKSRNP